ncbi:MAG: NUDIX domain-containing protein [Bacteroidales bacterium]|nr:NUDIX domain-containing protein [Bacteroidales bacterium]MEE0983934.1 NUDIX domain-containing protein [Bacteroidales bacterium]
MTTEEVFSKAIKKLKFVQAAGGLVQNEENEFLFIYRAKHWDLPKGHRETGEDLDFTAVREVEEETGIENIDLKEYIGTTYHTYILNGKREIKETHWYSMSAKKTEKLVPQKEEGIQKAEWLTKEKIESQAKKIYPSIQDLLIRIGFCFNQTL